jgi:S1-C subfamily serine protease
MAAGVGLVAAGTAVALTVANTGGSGNVAGSGSELFPQQQPTIQVPNGQVPNGQLPNNGSSQTSASMANATQKRGVVVINSVLGYQGAISAGTGLVLSSDGEVLTNNHVIQGATRIVVTIASTGTRYTATVVGTDATDDVAVIKLNNASGLTTATIDKDGNAKVGDKVTAVGNAGGTGSLTAATGSIVALNRSITATDDNGQNAEKLRDLIQVDADVVSGDSGGPLYDKQNEIIGIDTAAGQSRTGGSGYAIPIDNALEVAAQIEQGVSTSTIHIGNTGMLGVTVVDTNGKGAGIATVIGNGAAAKAGLQQGDVITSVNGTKITSGTALQNFVRTTSPGQKVQVHYTDPQGATHSTSVTLGVGPAA